MTTALMVIAPTVFRDEEYAEPKRVLEAHGVVGDDGERDAWRVYRKARDACHGDDRPSVMPRTRTGTPSCSLAERVRRCSSMTTLHTVSPAPRPSPAACSRQSASRHRRSPTPVSCEGVRATAFPSQEQDLRARGAVWTGDSVTVDGKIVTGNGPEAAEQFGEAVAATLGV